MLKKFTHFSLIAFVSAVFILGFIIVDKNPHGSRTQVNRSEDRPVQPEIQTDNSPIYTDNFDGANDTTALKARGYLVFRNGPGPAGLTACWFQGNPAVFSAFNGPSSGYVASNYNSAIGNNAIDNWMVLPRVTGGINAGDSLYFYSQSPLSSTYPDSMKVMYSLNDSTPTGSWTELGRFKVNVLGIWERKGFRAPTASVNGRFAIRYGCIDGGPAGNNTDYSGIDALVIERNTTGIGNNNGEMPSSYSLFQNYPNPFNPSTTISYSLPKAGYVKLAVYDVLGNEVSVVVDGHQKAGFYQESFDASKLSSGTYFYRLTAGVFTSIKKMVLIK